MHRGRAGATQKSRKSIEVMDAPENGPSCGLDATKWSCRPFLRIWKPRPPQHKIERRRTDDHARKLETLPDALPVDLVGEICETDVAHELFPDDTAKCGGAAIGRRSAAVDGTVSVAAVLVRLGRR